MARITTPLSDAEIKRTKAIPEANQKLSDGGGLYLLIEKSGSKKWRMDYLQIGQYQDFKSKLERFNGDVAHFAQDLPLATQRAKEYKALSLTHDVSEHDWSEKEQARIELEGQLTDAQHQRDALIYNSIWETTFNLSFFK